MYCWVEELSPPLAFSSVVAFLAWNNGCNRLLSFKWCSPEVYGSMSEPSMSTATCKSEHKCQELSLLDPARPGYLRKLWALWYPSLYPLSASFSVLLWALILLISPRSCSAFSFLLFSFVWSPILPPSFHTSASCPFSILQLQPIRWNT